MNLHVFCNKAITSTKRCFVSHIFAFFPSILKMRISQSPSFLVSRQRNGVALPPPRWSWSWSSRPFRPQQSEPLPFQKPTPPALPTLQTYPPPSWKALRHQPGKGDWSGDVFRPKKKGSQKSRNRVAQINSIHMAPWRAMVPEVELGIWCTKTSR